MNIQWESVLLPMMPLRSIPLVFVLLLVGVAVNGQNEMQTRPEVAAVPGYMLKHWTLNKIQLGTYDLPASKPRTLLNRPAGTISVSGSMLDEFGDVFIGMYSMSTKVIEFKVRDRDVKRFAFKGSLGLKGGEAKMVGLLSKKTGSTINLQYQYSLEDLLLNGTGHSVKVVKEF